MGGSPGYVYRDGQRLTPAMLYDFLQLDKEFFERTGCHLKISSGIRTDEEHLAIWYARYTRTPNGRRVYDTRWWNGALWYRISPEGTVATPGTSNHQINVAAGRMGALDLYDTGSDAGILTRGSFRANVFDEIAPKYGYDSEGYAFQENWHKRYNRNPWRAIPAGGIQEEVMSAKEVWEYGIGDNGDPGGDMPAWMRLSWAHADGAYNRRKLDEISRKLDAMAEGMNDMGNSAVQYDRKDANGKVSRVYLIFNTVSGWYHEYSNGPGNGPMNKSYNNPLAATLKTGSYAQVTESHARVIKEACNKVLAAKA